MFCAYLLPIISYITELIEGTRFYVNKRRGTLSKYIYGKLSSLRNGINMKIENSKFVFQSWRLYFREMSTCVRMRFFLRSDISKTNGANYLICNQVIKPSSQPIILVLTFYRIFQRHIPRVVLAQGLFFHQCKYGVRSKSLFILGNYCFKLLTYFVAVIVIIIINSFHLSPVFLVSHVYLTTPNFFIYFAPSFCLLLARQQHSCIVSRLYRKW